jgi:Lon protease-like protein
VSVRLLPLFPLPLVLFPGAPLPLHIFEPRYRRMVEDCLASDSRFGILFRPDDVAELELPPGHVGCVACIDREIPLSEGRSNIIVHGEDRFALQRFVASPAPYHVGEVAEYDDVPEPSSALAPIAEEVLVLFDRVGHAARELADDENPLPALPDDPSALAFGIAAMIDIEASARQSLLASRSASDRLRRVEQILSTAMPSLELRARVHARAKSNGHGPSAPPPSAHA